MKRQKEMQALQSEENNKDRYEKRKLLNAKYNEISQKNTNDANFKFIILSGNNS